MLQSNISLLIILVPIVATAIVQIIVALKTSSKISEINTKADVITGHVNSAATAATAKITALQAEVASLRQVISDDKEKAALLAQTAAITQASNLTPPKE